MLNLETRDLPQAELRAVESGESIDQASGPQALDATLDYEIVLGRPQIASWLFVGVIAIAICSSLAFLAGERIAAQNTAPISAPVAPPAPASLPVPVSAELPEVKLDLASPVQNQISVAPLFAEPAMGRVYIQIGAVERGMAMLLAEGLRSHGFDSFVAPGPNDKLFRVLIGPLPDPAAYRQAMLTVNAMDLASFARRYEK
jgi:cell division septation protein DedD